MIPETVDFEYITTDNAVGRAIEALRPAHMVGFDCETTDLDPLAQKGRLRLVSIAPRPDFAYVFDTWKLGREGKALLRDYLSQNSVIKVAHNAKFDIKWVRAHLGVNDGFDYVVDTMLAHMLEDCGQMMSGFGLADSVWHFLDHSQLDKAQQTSDWTRTHLDEEQIQYSAKDACVLLPLWEAQAPVLKELGLLNTARIEFECVDAIANLELNGILVHRERWKDIADTIQAQWKQLRYELQDLLSEVKGQSLQQGLLFQGAPAQVINPNSYDQLIPALLRLGVPLPVDEETGHHTTRNFRIESLALDYHVIERLLEYRGLEKMRSSYGLRWFQHINWLTGRVHADFHQIGPKTGRMACSNPNIQQIPIKNDIGRKFRRCFVAGPGNFIVGGDYSQFELRILTDYCGDPGMKKAFNEGLDFHTYSAQQMFKTETPTEDDRHQAKINNFASVYGAGITRLALMAKISLDDAKRLMGLDRAAFPKKYQWLEREAHNAVKNGYSRTRSGRLVKYVFDPNDKVARSTVERNGKNTPIQGTNADVIKRAMGLLNRKLKGQREVQHVHVVHDELLLEAPWELAHDAEAMLKDIMLKAGQEFVKSVPVKVDTRIGEEWSK